MNFEETVKSIDNFLCSSLSVPLGRKKEEFIFVFNRVYSDIMLMQEDKVPCMEDSIVNKVISTLSYLLSLYTEYPISPEISLFSKSYALIISNWNNNIFKNENISEKCKLIDRIYENHLTSLELISVMKKLILQANRYQNFAIPSIELSKHYMKTLED